MTIAEQIERAKADYDAVYEAGAKAEYDIFAAVYEAGKKAEQDAFWDAYQNYGKRIKYETAFAGVGWTDETFSPKYDLICGWGYCATSMFNNSLITDVQGTLEKRGLVLDTSRTFLSSFANCAQSQRWGVIDATYCANSSSGFSFAFYGAQCETIDKLVVTDKLVTTNGFTNADKLMNITIEGTIGTSFDIKWSPLTVASMKSIINALKNYAGTDSEYAYTLSFSEDCWAALEADGTSPNGTTWKEYVRSLGWNV